MVMVAVPVPGPPQVPGAVGQTSAAPESWMVKVAVLGSARAPLAVMTVATADRAMVMTAMAISRLPIERSFPLGRTPASGCCQVNHRPSGLVPVLLGAFGSCTATADGDAHCLGGNPRGRRPLVLVSSPWLPGRGSGWSAATAAPLWPATLPPVT
jgi:hypothetical protein